MELRNNNCVRSGKLEYRYLTNQLIRANRNTQCVFVITTWMLCLAFSIDLEASDPRFDEPTDQQLVETLLKSLKIRSAKVVENNEQPSTATIQDMCIKYSKNDVCLSDLKIFTSQSSRRANNNNKSTTIIARLPKPMSGYRVAVAFNNKGEVKGAELTRHPGFSESEKREWNSFIELLRRNVELKKSVVSNPMPTRDEVEHELMKLKSSEDSNYRTANTLHKQRLAMRMHSYRFSQLDNFKKQGTPPKAAWLRNWSHEFENMSKLSDELKGVYGESFATQYREISSLGKSTLETAAKAITRNDMKAFSKAFRNVYPNVCQQCHNTEVPKLGGTAYTLRKQLPDLSVRGDLTRVNVDVWPMPEQLELSQMIADAFKICLIAAGQMQTP